MTNKIKIYRAHTQAKPEVLEVAYQPEILAVEEVLDDEGNVITPAIEAVPEIEAVAYQSEIYEGYQEFKTREEAEAVSDNVTVHEIEVVDPAVIQARQEIVREIVILKSEITQEMRDDFTLGIDVVSFPAKKAQIATKELELSNLITTNGE